MKRLYPILICLLFSIQILASREIAGIDLDTLERPAGISLSSQEILKEQRAKRKVTAALRLITTGETEAATEDEFSRLYNQTIDKSDVREAGEKKIEEGEAMLKKAADELLEIYATAKNRAELTFQARNSGMLHEWTSTDGRTLSASLVSMSAGAITVMTADGTEYKIPLDRLIETDRSVAKILDTGRGFTTTGFLETIEAGNLTELGYFIDAGFELPQEVHGEAFTLCLGLEQSSPMLKRLVNIGLNVNSLSADGMTALSQAVQAKELAPVRILTAAGADPLLRDKKEPGLSPIVMSLHKWDPVISALLFLESKEKVDDFLASLSEFLNTEYFKPISLGQAKQLQELVSGKELAYNDLQTFKLSLLGLELTITDLEKCMIAKELRPLVVCYHALGFYRHTIRRNQEYLDKLIEIWDRQHEAGDYSASYTLALAHLDGWGSIGIPGRAKDYLTRGIEAEHTPSIILMGEILEEGLLGEVDESKAYEYYRKASGLSDPLGMVKMGHSFEKGISVEQNHAKAIEWYKRAVENGSTEGMAQLGRCYLEGIGVRTNARLGLDWYTRAAEADNPSAMFFLGRELILGGEIRKNVRDGMEWLERAAEFGELDALLLLGIAYTDGTVREDLRLANSYFKEAAERGDVESMYRYANNLKNGAGTQKDMKKAFEWYAKAAEQEHLESINQLGVCYLTGTGTKQDERQAYSRFKKASSLGHIEATANLAVCYARGLGVGVDEEEAARLSLQVNNSNDSAAKQIIRGLFPED